MSDEVPKPMAQIRLELGVSPAYFSAIKSAMGLSGVHMGFTSKFSKWIADNPDFRFADVYHPKGCKCNAERCVKRRAKASQLQPA